jgi:thiamine kinase-like enzyme
MSVSVESILAAWQDWPLPLSAAPTIKAQLDTGRTNRNLRLDAPGLGEDLVLRIHHPDAARLGIDREREQAITHLTAAADVGRPVWHWTRDYSIFPFIEARSWTDSDFSDPGQRSRLRPLIEQLVALDTGQARRRYSDYLQHYWSQLETCSSLDRSLRREWSAFWPDLLAFDEAAWSAGLVHHDLVPANVLDAGERLILIDWEYAAMGHRDIDRWTVDPSSIDEPFVAELMTWINRLWERLVRM